MPVYFDNAATTGVRREVLDEMLPFFDEFYENPSSIYEAARNAKKHVEKGRERVAKLINADVNEIYFTSGGTEADNWAIKGVIEASSKEKKHIITTNIEHKAVLNSCHYLEKKGVEVTYIPVNSQGIVEINELEKAIRPETVLISVMYANNEIGTIQPIGEIGCIARKNSILFHTDAVQAVGHIPIDVKNENIDLLTMSGHKLYAGKGVGALFIRKGVKLAPLLHGGSHERNKRAGTENVSGIVGFGKACELASAEMNEEAERLIHLRDKLIDGILQIPNTIFNGHRTKRLPGNVNVSFEFIEGESLLLMLDIKKIYTSSGSACTSGSLDPSHVLLAIGLPHEKAHGSLRLTLGRYNTEEEVDILLAELPPIVQRLRDMSPLC